MPTVIQKSLLKHLGLPEKVENSKRKANGNSIDVNKKVKLSDVDHDEMPCQAEKVSYLFKILFYSNLIVF